MQTIATSWLKDSQDYRAELREIEQAERQAEKDLQEESQKWQKRTHAIIKNQKQTRLDRIPQRRLDRVPR